MTIRVSHSESKSFGVASTQSLVCDCGSTTSKSVSENGSAKVMPAEVGSQKVGMESPTAGGFSDRNSTDKVVKQGVLQDELHSQLEGHRNSLSPTHDEQTQKAKANCDRPCLTKNCFSSPLLHHQGLKQVRFSSPSTVNYNGIGQCVSSNTREKYPSDFRIGIGCDLFELKLSIEKCVSLSQLVTSLPNAFYPRCWLSFRCFDSVIQSDKFSPVDSNDTQCFVPMIHTFRIRSSISELIQHFKDKKNSCLRVHVCTDGEVLGTASIDFRPLFSLDSNKSAVGVEKGFEGRMSCNNYPVVPRKKSVTNDDERDINIQSPHIFVRMCAEREIGSSTSNDFSNQQSSTGELFTSISSQTDLQEKRSESANKSSSPVFGKEGAQSARQEIVTKFASVDNDQVNDDLVKRSKILEEKEIQLKNIEAALAKKEKDIDESKTSLEKHRIEWEKWRHQEELDWHDKLRKKEAATMRSIEERVSAIEKERLGSLESSRREYEHLEARLRKALLEVEAKERQLKDVEANHLSERKRKLAELELKEKLLKEEAKHSIEIERAKANAALEQAVAAEKSAATATKKVKQIEGEMDHLREQHRKTPEVALVQQLAEMKGQIADCERRIEIVNTEKKQILLEKEEFRVNVHKLARALRQEREKAIAKRQIDSRQIRLSYDTNDRMFVLDGEKDEIQRILVDLNKISRSQQSCVKASDPSASSFAASASKSTEKNSQPFSSEDSIPCNNPPPTPIRQPQRPSGSKMTPPPNPLDHISSGSMPGPGRNANIHFSLSDADSKIGTPSTVQCCSPAFATGGIFRQNGLEPGTIEFDQIIATPT